jgi:hypothetical protein
MHKIGENLEDLIVAQGEVYWLQRRARWAKVDPVRIKTRRGIISKPNPFLDFVGTTIGGVSLWFEAKSTNVPYLNVSCDKGSRGLKETQLEIFKSQMALGAHPFIIWEYRAEGQLRSKIMFVPGEAVLEANVKQVRLKADDFSDIRSGQDILILESFFKQYP